MRKKLNKAKAAEEKKVMTGYFQVSWQRMKDICSDKGGGLMELAAYLVLCGGVSKASSDVQRVSTHGAQSVATRTGKSYDVAVKAINWLEAHQFIEAAEPSKVVKPDDRRAPRWIVDREYDCDLCIAQPFLDPPTGQPKEGTLAHLLRNGGVADYIPMRNGLIDALIVFAGLHTRYDLSEYGGVDPRAVGARCISIDDGADGLLSTHRRAIVNDQWTLVTEQVPRHPSGSCEFINDCLGSVSEWSESPELRVRFDHALKQLRELHLVLPAVVLWDADPVDRTHRRDPSVICTLHTNAWFPSGEKHQISQLMHQTLIDTGLLDSAEVYGESRGMSAAWNGTGVFRYAIQKNEGLHATLVQQLRPRWAPLNNSGKLGVEAEKRRYADWSQRMESLKSAPGL